MNTKIEALLTARCGVLANFLPEKRWYIFFHSAIAFTFELQLILLRPFLMGKFRPKAETYTTAKLFNKAFIK
jgi:hypothetical protein